MNTLNAELHTSVTPALLNNIQIMNVSSDDGVTLGLINANQVQEVNNISSSAVLTVNNIVTTADLGVQDLFEVSGGVTPDAIFSFRPGYTGPIDLAVQNVGIDQNSVEVEINASSTYQSIATVNLESLGEQRSYVTLTDAGASAADITTVNVTGDNDLSLVAGLATLVNASTFTGGLTFTLQAAGNGTIYGGSGSDILTGNGGNDVIVTGNGSNQVYLGGPGDSSVVGGDNTDFVEAGTYLSATDSLDGGLGTNRLGVDYATAAAVSAPLTNVNNFQSLELTTSAAGNVNVANIDSTITTVYMPAVNLAGNTLTVNDAATTVLLSAASAGALTIVDAASSTSNSVTITNYLGTATDTFSDEAITATGIESLTLNTGSTATAQTISTLTILGEALTTPVSVSVSGGNAIDFTRGLASTATALLSVDLSGLTAQAAGTATSGINSIVTDGNVSIIGSAGEDRIAGDATGSNTIVGNAGADILAGGAVADSLTGGAGNDFLYGGGGNDTMLGGDDNDFITTATPGLAFNAGTVSIDAGAGNDVVLVGNTLNSSDTINGGEGRDTLAVETNIIASYAGATNFEIFRVDATGINQNLALYTGTTFDKVVFNIVGGSDTVTGAAATVTDVLVLNGQTLANFQHTNAANNAVTLGGYTDTNTSVAFITAVNEETIVIGDGNLTATGAGNNTFTIGTLTGGDLTTLIFDGVTEKVITNAIAGVDGVLTTVNASSNTGTVSVSVANATVGVAMTGSATAASTLTGGTAADTITGGAVADSLVGGAGADSMTGGTGADVFAEQNGQSVARTAETITEGGIVAGQTITFGNGVDVITDFVSGTDDIRTVTATNYTLLGVGSAVTGLTLTNNYGIRGNFDQLTGLFTQSATGADTLVFTDIANTTLTDATNTGAVVLVGTSSVVAGDFI